VEIVDGKLVQVIRAAHNMGLPVVYATNSSPRIEILRSTFGLRLGESLGFDPTHDFRENTVDPIEFDSGEPVQLHIPPQIALSPAITTSANIRIAASTRRAWTACCATSG